MLSSEMLYLLETGGKAEAHVLPFPSRHGSSGAKRRPGSVQAGRKHAHRVLCVCLKGPLSGHMLFTTRGPTAWCVSLGSPNRGVSSRGEHGSPPRGSEVLSTWGPTSLLTSHFGDQHVVASFPFYPVRSSNQK